VQFRIKKSDQNEISEQIRSEGRYGEKSIQDAVMEYSSRKTKYKENVIDANYCEIRLKNVIKLMNKTVHELHDFCVGFGMVTIIEGLTTREDISDKTMNAYHDAINKLAKTIEHVGCKIDSRVQADKK